MRLNPARFDEWFRAFNNLKEDEGPFSWQRRLFRDWLCPVDPQQARWPSLVQLPTASGKTALIDLAVLALAAGSSCARRRIAFVVDRRVVVDEAARRAVTIAERLRRALDSKGDPLQDVARELVSLGGEEPLVVATLRGGIPGDDGWARSPAQPAVILSTVDQAGSRLLFRTYGSHGPRSWPIHAGLLGLDTLLIIDEAHSAAPFCQTVRAIADRWQGFAEQVVGEKLALVRMSATPGEEPDFRLEEEERRDLAQRLCAPKPAELLLVKAKGENHRAQLIEAIIECSKKLLGSMATGVLGIVVNRVRDARTVFERLDLAPEHKLLLTGRARGWQRDQLLEQWMPRLRAGVRKGIDAPLAVVATQCIEIGANLDFDALVSEVASLDALRQRFGRLNRLGDRKTASAVILAASPQIETNEAGDAESPDPVYGHTLARTWVWLDGHAAGEPRSVDFGVDALESILPQGQALSRLCQDVRSAYPLLTSHLDLLAQTSPPPDPDPEISAFLHGTTRTSPDVTVVWRADLPAAQPGVWGDRVAVQPPATGEGCPVPIWEFRRWLANGSAWSSLDDSGDVEGIGTEAEAERDGKRIVLRWRGFDEADLVSSGEVMPGDTVVIPAAYGGCDDFGWNPASPEPVADIGDAAAHAAGRKPVLRLEALAQVLCRSERASEAEKVLSELRAWAAGEDDAPAPRDSLTSLAEISDLPEWIRDLARLLAGDVHRRVVEAGGAYGLVGWRGSAEDLSTADDRSSHSVTVPLADYSAGVRDYAERFARAVVLPDRADSVVSDLALAGWLHDVGKADPRFQVWLHSGDELAAALAETPLAKSSQNPRNRAAIHRARERAGYPQGGRHEVQSLALIVDQQQICDQANDWDLVQHLVVSHHGFGRPFVPVVFDPQPVDVALRHGDVDLAHRSNYELYRIEAGVPERYWRLVRRYGWWGLAWLEAILRPADQRRSEYEEKWRLGDA